VAADRATRAGSAKRRKPAIDPNLKAVDDTLTRSLGTRVRVRKRGRGGVIEIEFYSDPELERLLARLAPEIAGGGF
jgi:hypothetical protein